MRVGRWSHREAEDMLTGVILIHPMEMGEREHQGEVCLGLRGGRAWVIGRCGVDGDSYCSSWQGLYDGLYEVLSLAHISLHNRAKEWKLPRSVTVLSIEVYRKYAATIATGRSLRSYLPYHVGAKDLTGRVTIDCPVSSHARRRLSVYLFDRCIHHIPPSFPTPPNFSSLSYSSCIILGSRPCIIRTQNGRTGSRQRYRCATSQIPKIPLRKMCTQAECY